MTSEVIEGHIRSIHILYLSISRVLCRETLRKLFLINISSLIDKENDKPSNKITYNGKPYGLCIINYMKKHRYCYTASALRQSLVYYHRCEGRVAGKTLLLLPKFRNNAYYIYHTFKTQKLIILHNKILKNLE